MILIQSTLTILFLLYDIHFSEEMHGRISLDYQNIQHVRCSVCLYRL